MHLLSPFSLNLPLYEHKKRPSYVLSSFAIILVRKREFVAVLLLPFGCLVTVNGWRLFLKVQWVGQQYVIVVVPDHTHLQFSFLFCYSVHCVLSSYATILMVKRELVVVLQVCS